MSKLAKRNVTFSHFLPDRVHEVTARPSGAFDHSHCDVCGLEPGPLRHLLILTQS